MVWSHPAQRTQIPSNLGGLLLRTLLPSTPLHFLGPSHQITNYLHLCFKHLFVTHCLCELSLPSRLAVFLLPWF